MRLRLPGRPAPLVALLLGSYLALVAPAVVVLVLWTGFNLQRATLEHAAGDLDARAALLAPLLREPLAELGPPRRGQPPALIPLGTLVRTYAQSTGDRVVVVDRALRVAASSDDSLAQGAQLAAADVLPKDGGPDLRRDPTTNQQRLYSAAPIREDVRLVVGFVQVSHDASEVAEAIRTLWLTLVGGAALVLGGSAAGALLVARQIARPVQALTAATEAVAGGDLNRSVTPAGPAETRRLADAFNHMSAQVRQTLALQEAFVANAAHELRSPLASLQLRLEMIESPGGEDPALVTSYLRKLRGEVGSLQHLAEELLTLSVVSDPERSPKQPIDLAPLLYILADQHGPLAQDAGLRLDVQVPGHLPPVQANQSQMTMAVRNLLENAIKFTPAGGSVTLEAAEADGRVAVTVRDSGRGIDPAALPHIFERFFRVDRSEHHGAGLGLSLVHAVVTAHGGRVDVDSRPGQGSAFTISLPVAAV